MSHDFRPQIIAFDLDGTLVDTAPDLVAALNHVLESEDLDGLSLDAVRPLIGQGAMALIRRGFAEAGRALDDAETEDRLRNQFLDFYGDNIAIHSRPFAGAVAVLEHLRAERYRLSVCTNKPQALSEQLLDALGLIGHFDAIVGSDSIPARKPNPGHVFAAIERAGGTRDAGGVLVGDSQTDERAARAAGLPFLLFEHGYRDTALDQMSAFARFADYSVLPGLIGEALRTRSAPG